MTRLLIADDHKIVRQGLRQLLQITASDFDDIQEAADSSQTLELLRNQKFDLLLLDMSLPGLSGASLISKIRNQYASLPILVLSMHNDPQIANRAIAAGASGYLTKDNEAELLLKAMRKVAAGGCFIDPMLAEQIVFAAQSDSNVPPHEKLSAREYEVFMLIVQGGGPNEIAEKLAISNKTVSTHKMRLMKKLNITNTSDLVRYAIKHNLLEDV